MTLTDWDGPGLLSALQQATARLAQHVDEVNALNVFPVPDGDTGTNMLATLQAAIDEASSVAANDDRLATVAQAASTGALMGARGNSGVILSQLFRGMAEEMQSHETLDGRGLARALERGCDAAHAAVARPVRGTILTVARDSANAAKRAAGNDAALEAVLQAAVDEARAAVERTPSQLAVLRQAGVVDAGGRGLELVLLGALANVRGEAATLTGATPYTSVFPAFEALEEDGYGYETVYVVTPDEGDRLDAIAIRQQLEKLGESVLVAGDERAVKIHIHNERPDQVIAYGLSLGSLSRIVVENLDRQAHERRAVASAGALAADRPAGGQPAKEAAEAGTDTDEKYLQYDHEAGSAGAPANGPAVVAVAAGVGLARLFQTLGAAAVVQAANGANASAGELAEAIRSTGCRDVIVLPNNPNVRLAASQGGEMCPAQQVAVVATRNAAEGVAAMLSLDAALSLEVNAEHMHAASRAVTTMQVATAVRDARIGRRKVRRGQNIVLSAEQDLLAADNDRHQAVLQAMRRLGTLELITLYHGEGADADEARALSALLRREFEQAEVDVVEGGQKHYSYLISAE